MSDKQPYHMTARVKYEAERQAQETCAELAEPHQHLIVAISALQDCVAVLFDISQAGPKEITNAYMRMSHSIDSLRSSAVYMDKVIRAGKDKKPAASRN